MPATTTFQRLRSAIRRTAAADGATTFDDEKIRSSIQDGFRMVDSYLDWSFLRHRVRIATHPALHQTLDPDDGPSSVTATDGSATVTGSGVDFGTAGVAAGDYIEVDGEQLWYRVAAVAGAVLTLADPYRGNTSAGKSYIVTRPAITLPADFKSYRKLVPQSTAPNVNYVTPEYMLDLQHNYVGASQPWYWTHMQKEDASGEVIMFYAPPNDVWQYDLQYNRYIGWLDISESNAWVNEPTADGDIVLWDDRQMAVLRAAIIYAGYVEYEKTELQMLAKQRLETLLVEAASADQKDKEPMVFGGEYPSRPYWY